MFGPAAFITLLAAFSGVITMPFSHLLKTLPRDIAHIAVAKAEDAQSNNLGHRAASQCAQLSRGEAKSLPGWNTIVGYANNQWGGGSRNIDTSPAAVTSGCPVQVCITDDVVELSYPGNPVCQTHATSTEGSLVDTDGHVQIALQQGSNTDTSYTFSKIADVTAELSVSTDITDESSFIILAPTYRTDQLRCFL
ncbi:hypothetical protein EV421DRAFT_1744051 [Armillaria borealis]|uniref:Uncharacterized protein n=1 Tax=Armillaria borealis TaxID=47425 RepID=A0AA39IV73_9AGAR|nr:hypothetical protein EV421DRAFT_1744051 [Armillaria borealis]